MVSNRPGSLQTKSCYNIWIHLGIIPWNTHLAYGSMTARKYFSVWWSTIFVSNISLQRVLNIFKTLSEPNTSSQSTWKQQYTLELKLSGTICTELSYCLWQVMCTRHCFDSSINWEEVRNNQPIPVPQSSMDRRSNIRTLWKQQSISQIKKLTSCNRCVSLFCIIPLPSITLFSLISATFTQRNSKSQQTL